MTVAKNIYDLIGKTPMVFLDRLTADLKCRIALKLEFMNPFGSVKDRIALEMLKEAEASGELKAGSRIIEVSNGNAGVSLAAVARQLGYPVTIVMSESMSIERRILLLLLGADVILTPKEFGLRGALAKAHELIDQDKSLYFINQGDNLGNPRAHEKTAEEIWADTKGQCDIVVLGVGSGGTFRGISDTLRRYRPDIKMVAVEPNTSAVLSGGEPGMHAIPGIGPGVVPPHVKNCVLDEVITVSDKEARDMVKKVITQESIFIGIASGAAICAAFALAKRPENAGKLIVTMATSYTERYFSTDLVAEEKQIAENLPVSKIDQSYYAKLAELFG